MARPTVDAYFFAKDTISEAIAAYTWLLGRPDESEAWNAGPIICRYTPDFTILEGVATSTVQGGKQVAGYGVKDMMERLIAMGAKPEAPIVEGGAYSWTGDLSRGLPARRTLETDCSCRLPLYFNEDAPDATWVLGLLAGD